MANAATSRLTGRYLEVISQENVPPSQGEDAQQVINAFMEGRYDVYVGIIGHTLGSPTPRAQSGTLEEFARAVDARRKNPSLRVMFYLKRLHPKLSWAARVELMALREQFGANGVLYVEYRTAQELQNRATSDLSTVMQDWVTSSVEVHEP